MYPKTGCPEQQLNTAGPKFSEGLTYLCGGFKEFLIAYQNFDFTSSAASENGGKPQIGFGLGSSRWHDSTTLVPRFGSSESPRNAQEWTEKINKTYDTFSFFGSLCDP
jgi:hypothetical protein